LGSATEAERSPRSIPRRRFAKRLGVTSAPQEIHLDPQKSGDRHLSGWIPVA
jgi:hypothetical protein